VVLQDGLKSPSGEQLAGALSGVDRLTEFDIRRVTATAFGWLAGELTRADADSVAAALRAGGVPAVVAAEEEVWPPPHPRPAKRIICEPDALVVSALGVSDLRADWSAVAAAAAGEVNQIEVEHHPELRPIPSSAHRAMQSLEADGIEHQVATPTLRFALAGGESFEATLDGVAYGGEIARRARTRRDRFLLTVRSIAVAADRAWLNRGAAAVQGGSDKLLGYPSRKLFDREWAWLLWQAARQRA
jgi:hypothetical protein